MLTDQTITLAKGANFAVFSTVLPSGRIQSQVMWIDTDGEHLLINTELHRQKVRNIETDPTATVTIFDATSSYQYSEVRGTVVDMVRGPEARAHIDALSQKYVGSPYKNTIQSERVILKIAPDRVRDVTVAA
ncbi:MAG: TIGR03618 family F420-dependent PPOX class oxidoreductase [Acidimicrobiia bacterium]|nr:TIGR03618 family F420-dependent PPOX class oxidoreductase [Acidimicrobiia bacterium]